MKNQEHWDGPGSDVYVQWSTRKAPRHREEWSEFRCFSLHLPGEKMVEPKFMASTTLGIWFLCCFFEVVWKRSKHFNPIFIRDVYTKCTLDVKTPKSTTTVKGWFGLCFSTRNGSRQTSSWIWRSSRCFTSTCCLSIKMVQFQINLPTLAVHNYRLLNWTQMTQIKSLSASGERPFLACCRHIQAGMDSRNIDLKLASEAETIPSFVVFWNLFSDRNIPSIGIFVILVNRSTLKIGRHLRERRVLGGQGLR